MKTLTQIRILNSLKLFDVLRSFYYGLESKNSKVLNFYGQFIKKGDLCFDIGANIGRKIDIFLNLGANVIAVEPNPQCVNFLKWKYKNNPNITIMPVALDRQESQKDIYLCEVNSLSSLSKDWIDSRSEEHTSELQSQR